MVSFHHRLYGPAEEKSKQFNITAMWTVIGYRRRPGHGELGGFAAMLHYASRALIEYQICDALKPVQKPAFLEVWGRDDHSFMQGNLQKPGSINGNARQT